MYREIRSAKSVGELRKIFEPDKANENASGLSKKAYRSDSDSHISSAVYKPAGLDENVQLPMKQIIDDMGGSDPLLPSEELFSKLYTDVSSSPRRRSPIGASIENVCFSPTFSGSLENVKEETSLSLVNGDPGDEKSKIANLCAEEFHESCSNSILIRINRNSQFPDLKALKNYLLVIDGPFDQIDTASDIKFILRKIQENVQNEESTCKMIVVMQRETFAFVKTYFNRMEWLQYDQIIDLSSSFGNKSSKEDLINHITNMDGHCLLLLGAIAMTDGTLQCRRLHCANQEDLLWHNVSVFAGVSFQNSKIRLLCKVAYALKGIYITEKSDSYIFINETVSDAVHLSLLMINGLKYMEECPLSKISLYSICEMTQTSMYEIFEKRVIREMGKEFPRLVELLEMEIWQKEDIVKKIGPKLVKSVLSLKENILKTFLQLIYRNKHIPLLSYFFIALPDLKYSLQDKTIVLDTWTAGNSKHLCLCREQILNFETKSAQSKADICEYIACPLISDLVIKEFIYSPDRRTLYSDSVSPATDLQTFMLKKRERNGIVKGRCRSYENNFEWETLHLSTIWREKAHNLKTFCRLLYGLDNEENYKTLMFRIGKELFEKWYIEIAFNQTDTRSKVVSIYPGLKDSNCFMTSTIIEIVKRKFKVFHTQLEVLNLWTGTRCRKDKHSHEGIDTIVAIVKERILPINDTFFGLHVVVREERQVSQEASDVIFQTSSCFGGSKLKEIKGITFNSLLMKHTNITLISFSQVISRAYGKKNANIVHSPCVVIYCRVKGIVPLGEEEFPRKIDGHPIDVREGFCEFAVDAIRAGDKVTSEKREGTGTLGAFVDYAESRKNAFITCAHVLYPINELNERLKTLSKKNVKNVSINLDGQWHSIGRIKFASFCNTQADEISIDAALVDLTDFSYVNDGKFSETYSGQQLKRAGIENEDISFSSGETDILNEGIRDKILIKVGAESGLTVGTLGEKCSSNIDILNEDGSFRFTLHNQTEILPISVYNQPFLKSGDSGAFVFAVENRRPLELKCIGMAVASTSFGSCIMTPINPIFKALDLPQNCLSCYRNQSVERVSGDPTYQLLLELTGKVDTVIEDNKKLSQQFTNFEVKINDRVTNLEKKHQDSNNN
ncbi:uncharacterized protein LOC134277293 isoform X2 [Saccostrea cucullata]|uniref:uncharacterized protein LOC134277293 isoform X2 n=1 Tax=Saccostrea cuccullata TaxID=36930 RepID=UPI002ED531D0